MHQFRFSFLLLLSLGAGAFAQDITTRRRRYDSGLTDVTTLSVPQATVAASSDLSYGAFAPTAGAIDAADNDDGAFLSKGSRLRRHIRERGSKGDKKHKTTKAHEKNKPTSSHEKDKPTSSHEKNKPTSSHEKNKPTSSHEKLMATTFHESQQPTATSKTDKILVEAGDKLAAKYNTAKKPKPVKEEDATSDSADLAQFKKALDDGVESAQKESKSSASSSKKKTTRRANVDINPSITSLQKRDEDEDTIYVGMGHSAIAANHKTIIADGMSVCMGLVVVDRVSKTRAAIHFSPGLWQGEFSTFVENLETVGFTREQYPHLYKKQGGQYVPDFRKLDCHISVADPMTNFSIERMGGLNDQDAWTQAMASKNEAEAMQAQASTTFKLRKRVVRPKPKVTNDGVLVYVGELSCDQDGDFDKDGTFMSQG